MRAASAEPDRPATRIPVIRGPNWSELAGHRERDHEDHLVLSAELFEGVDALHRERDADCHGEHRHDGDGADPDLHHLGKDGLGANPLTLLAPHDEPVDGLKEEVCT
jgi:hypothetical protein